MADEMQLISANLIGSLCKRNVQSRPTYYHILRMTKCAPAVTWQASTGACFVWQLQLCFPNEPHGIPCRNGTLIRFPCSFTFMGLSAAQQGSFACILTWKLKQFVALWHSVLLSCFPCSSQWPWLLFHWSALEEEHHPFKHPWVLLLTNPTYAFKYLGMCTGWLFLLLLCKYMLINEGPGQMGL